MWNMPNLNPVAFQCEFFTVHWYGLMYLLGFWGAWMLANKRVTTHLDPTWGKPEISELVFSVAIGVIIGGRLGYVLFYQPQMLWQHPWEIFAVWQGGMSFHGGLLGVLVMMFRFAGQHHKSFFELTDFIAPLVPIGLGAGRIGNFINGELWGRPTTMPWGTIFPGVDIVMRHPSPLYEAFLEGPVLFWILWKLSQNPQPTKTVSAWFLICYGIIRFFLENFREPDRHLGFIAFDWLTMGQLLSLPMVLIGLLLLRRAGR